LGVVAGGDEQAGGGVETDTVAFEEPWGGPVDGVGDPRLEVVDFGGKADDPVGQQP